ncbi:MAG TPA: hypothetical protein VFV67_25165 [Actinophytocola sp.]|uniref:hypothetical protein n=1 Tax=Actinophytocola sp. TaxID=1872138 RepID=UPI002DB91D16|nr:hypothetical protein [Actinophytocola sp.]HEU5473950.1 hypothetical protein [Actinophytocola sp.]
MSYQVPSGLAAMLGAGILAGLAPAASVAGAWLLVGLVFAAAAAVGCGLSIRDRLGILGILGRIAGASAVATTFGAYLLPAHPLPAAIVLVAAGTGLTMAGMRPSRTFLAVGAALVLAVLVLFVVVCFAVAPPAGNPDTGGPAGLPAATALMLFCFLGFDRAGTGDRRRRWPVLAAIGVALVVCLAVGGAALYQLGSARLALSDAPLLDALAAADAAGLGPVVTAGAALATVLVLLGLFDDLRQVGRPVLVPAAGVAAAAGAALLPVPVAMVAAAALMVGQYLVGGRVWHGSVS